MKQASIIHLLVLALLLLLSPTFTVANAQVCENKDGSTVCTAEADDEEVCNNPDGSTVCGNVENDDDDDDATFEEDEVSESLQDLMDWIREQGGYIHPSLGVGYSLQGYNEFGNPTFQFGVFVKGDHDTLPKGERLLSIPKQALLQNERPGDFGEEAICLLGDKLAFERYYNRQKETAEANGEEDTEALKGSSFEPYVNFLEAYVIDHTNVPATWSNTGQSLLRSVFNKDDPFFASSFSEYYRCFEFDIFGEGNDHRHAQDSMMQDVDYWDELLEVALAHGHPHNKLIPIFDLIQHSNDAQIINVNAMLDDDDESWTVLASCDLPAKAELRISYYTPESEGFTKNTKEIFQNHGIVEDYPQRWSWDAFGLDVEIVQKFDSGGDDDKEEPELELHWLSNTLPDDDAIYFLGNQILIWQQWTDLVSNMSTEEDASNNTDQESASEDETLLPQAEKRLLLEYVDAHTTALKLVLDAMKIEQKANKETQYQLNEEKVVINNLDSKLFNQYQCNTLIQRVFDGDFETIEKVRSAYQQITYYNDPETDDVCLYLDGVYQQCVSYWPHYHELVVHKPAKYLKEDLKRVLWVGGGDSGPLNEFLKYPSLELAVGLELDQQVTRSAFKHFASRPHFDNPKVQWWYGDASKSLLMLPEHYFGSFDLVVVDLSDTVFSLSVSAELDVIEAISLLLRPGGIFEMNELFLKKVSKVFEYSMHYQFSDVPKICDQAAIFASNDVDFMNQELTEHTLLENATLLVEKDSMLTKHRFDRVHDYRHNPNPAFKKLCNKVQDNSEEPVDEKPQSTAPGIMMIVEAENLAADLSSAASVQSAVIDATQVVGLTVVADKSPSLESPWFTIVMKEGYVVVRLWAEEKYCALDIHLWSSFDSHEALKKAIVVDALGGDLMNKSTSSYRIVAGGMFGMSNWKEESKKHGPQLDQLCTADESLVRDQASPKEVKMQALELSLDVLRGTGLTAVVLCGTKGTKCTSLDVVKTGEKFARVIPIYDTAPKGSAKAIDQTVEKARGLLDRHLPESADLIDAIIFDETSTEVSTFVYQMMGEEQHLDYDNIFVVGTTDTKSEIWRRQYLNIIKEEIEMDPVFRAMVLLNTTSSSLELSITASGDPLFMEHLSEAVASSQETSSSVDVESRNVVGGFWRDGKQHMCEDSEFSQVTVNEDYNHDDARSQWVSQTALATQTLLQFSNMVDGTPTLVQKGDLVKACTKAFATRIGASMQVYDEFGGDGAICAGTWETGTAVVTWDGRSEVDLNIFSTVDTSELRSFEEEMKSSLSNLGGWLRDIYPRGYGRVVNFKEKLRIDTTNFFSE